jgi:hypothetical protein
VVALLAACAGDTPRDGEPGRDRAPPTARLDIDRTLRADLEARRHPSDGGGRVRLEPDADSSTGGAIIASSSGRWTLVYAAGPAGVAVGGTIFFQAPPFWGWSAPQIEQPDAPGYTRVYTDADGVTLTPRALDAELLAIEVGGRALRSGDEVRIAYGAGPAGAVADRYAERGSRFWIAVDGDGDGVRATVPESPAIEIRAGPASRLELVVPSTARPGDSVRLTAALLDAAGNANVEAEGAIALEGPAGFDLPPIVQLAPADRGRVTVPVRATTPGVYRFRATGPGGLVAESNPLEVSRSGPRVLWADLHGHSNFSDGTGTPEDYFGYARDVAALDVAALTDHDHWGMEFIDRHPELWEEIRRETARFHEPHRFVTLLGFEWTNWIHGHRHVLYFSDRGDVLSSLDPATDTPSGLWQALAGRDALTIAHHSAGGPVAVNWDYPPDPVLEPVTEVVSVHGSSEAEDSPGRIYSPVMGNFVRDALDRGYRLGFLGSGDSHDGHPGNAHLAAPSGGLAAILSEDLTRPAVLAALRARRVYATSGPRILLRASLGMTRMGGVFESEPGATQDLAVRVLGTAPIERLEVIRSGAVVERVGGEGSAELTAVVRLADLGRGEYVYVRVVQHDGGLAWSSPVFVE